MSTSNANDSAKEQRVNEVIAAFLQAEEGGKSPDRQALLAAHPDLADELRAFFADHDRFHRAAAPLQAAVDQAGESPTLDGSAPSSSGPGTKVRYFGDYEIVEEIARGGMGVVYKARQASLNRTVALKMILAGQLATSAEVKRFHTEAEAAANLQHPNIVAIHEVGEHEGQHYFSMDYVEGRNLAELVRGGPLPPVRAAAYVKTIAEAIHFAHQRGTLHRDLKPQNVLIDADDRPRITDFGLAKLTQSDDGLTQTGAALGSPSYMPPEQAEGRHDQVGPHSDVYSLGAILYCLLTGRPPFQGATPLETLRQAVETLPASPRKLHPDVPPDLETIALKCLEKQPERRYHSARELAEELGRFLNREPIHARPIGAARRAAFWAKRHPWPIAAVASVAIIALAMLAYGLWVENRFLVWKQAHPDYVRAAGPLTEQIDTIEAIATLLWIGLMYAQLYYMLRAKRLRSWRQLGDPIAHLLPRQSPGRGPTALLASLAGAAIILVFYLIARLVDAYVWEGTFRISGLLWTYALLYFGSVNLWWIATDSIKRAYGSPSRTLSPEQLAAISDTLLTGHLIGAIRQYRREVPDASLAEANDYVGRLAAELDAQHPGQVYAQIYGLQGLNSRQFALALLAEAVLFAAVVWLLPAELRVPLSLALVGGWLILPVIVIARWFQRPWVNLAAPAILVMAIGVGYGLMLKYYPQIGAAYLPVALLIGGAAGSAVVHYARRRPPVSCS